jgi:methylated-DNA-[protein]-cysteine S-methyltransferase
MKGFYYQTKLGSMFIAEDGQGITEVTLLQGEVPKPDGLDSRVKNSDFEPEETNLIREAAVQMMEYLDGTRKDFTVLLSPKGTSFQQKVWEALRAIPYGETRSYKQIAEAVGNKNASRAIGMANHHNPIMCIIPCHRVIGADGRLVGYAGGLDTKAELLKLEEKYR